MDPLSNILAILKPEGYLPPASTRVARGCAAAIAVREVCSHGVGFARIVLCCFSAASADLHRAALRG